MAVAVCLKKLWRFDVDTAKLHHRAGNGGYEAYHNLDLRIP